MNTVGKKSTVRQINKRLNQAEHQLKLNARRRTRPPVVQKTVRKAPRFPVPGRPKPQSKSKGHKISQGGIGTTSWRQNVANPFNDNVAKYPGLDIGPLSNAISTMDVVTTSMPVPTGTSTTGQSILIQWAPALCTPSSTMLQPHNRANTAVSPVMGYWVTLDATGKVIAMENINCEKILSMGADVKKARLLKAGVSCHVQQPRPNTGGYCYMNKGPDALFRLSGPDATGGAPSSSSPAGPTKLVVGDLAYIIRGSGTFPVATKSELAATATSVAFTIAEKLCDHDDFPLVSTPYDIVKASEFKPFVSDPTMSSLGPGQLWPDYLDPLWNPGWLLFQPTFSTSTQPDKIVADIQVQVHTAWEFLPHSGTFAHMARTDAAQASNMQQMQTPKPGMLHDFFGAMRRGAGWGLNHARGVGNFVGGFHAGMQAIEGAGYAPLALAL